MANLRQPQLVDLFEYRHLRRPDVLSLIVNISSTSSVKIGSLSSGEITWYFYGKRDPKRFEVEDMGQIVVKMGTGEYMELVFAKTSTNTYCCDSYSTKHIIQFVEYICSLYNTSVNNLLIHPSKLHHLSTIQSVGVLRESRDVDILEGTVSHEEMRRILTGFDFWNGGLLEICCHPEPNFTFDGAISIPEFRLSTGTWFKGPMLLNIANCYLFKCQENCGITEEHLNMFLRKWLDTGCDAIRHLLIEDTKSSEYAPEPRPRTWDMKRIVQGLASFEQEQWRTAESRRFCRENGTDAKEVCLSPGSCLIRPP